MAESNKKPKRNLKGDIKKVRSAVSKASYWLGLTENPSEAHPAAPAIRNRGGGFDRHSQFVSSVEGAKQGCADCYIHEMNKSPIVYLEKD